VFGLEATHVNGNAVATAERALKRAASGEDALPPPAMVSTHTPFPSWRKRERKRKRKKGEKGGHENIIPTLEKLLLQLTYHSISLYLPFSK